MPLKSYGVLRARAVARVREGNDDTPHYQVRLTSDAGVDHRASINVKSQQSPSELLFTVLDPFTHPIVDQAAGLPDGWTALTAGPQGGGLDFIRGNLFDATTMRQLAPDLAGPDNDLADLLDHHVLRAIDDPDARVFLFGEPWTEDGVPDKIFGFPDGAGVHDVHMNQGNSHAFARDDGVWQDGGVLIHYPSPSQWVAVFLAFQSQAWHTDDTTGHTLDSIPEGVSPRPGQVGARLRIVAALANPVGPAPEPETVTLVNAGADPVALAGWSIADRLKQQHALPAVTVGPGEALRLPLEPPVQLGNNGGLITLLDQQGLKVDGVAYTRDDAHAEGWSIVF